MKKRTITTLFLMILCLNFAISAFASPSDIHLKILEAKHLLNVALLEARDKPESTRMALLDKAETALKTFISENPKADDVPNAEIEIGRIMFERKQQAQAIAQFAHVVETFPQHSAAVRAQLEIGLL